MPSAGSKALLVRLLNVKNPRAGASALPFKVLSRTKLQQKILDNQLMYTILSRFQRTFKPRQ